MKFANAVCFSLVVALICQVSIAQETKTEGKACANCPSSAAVAKDGESCSQCPVSIAMKKLPTMTYQVGDKSVCCSESAAALAKEHSKPIHFVVGKKTFEDKAKAYTALVESTEKFVSDFITPCKCETSGKTTIAGKSCHCPVQASQNAELVKKAVGDVKMTYVVGKEKCNCPTQAKTLAAKSDEKTTYVVAGKETCCNLEARLNLAKAKYAAAVKALAAAEKKTETASAGS